MSRAKLTKLPINEATMRVVCERNVAIREIKWEREHEHFAPPASVYPRQYVERLVNAAARHDVRGINAVIDDMHLAGYCAARCLDAET